MSKTFSDNLFLIDLEKFLESPNPVFFKNSAGIYLYCNLPLANFLNLTSIEEIIGKSDNEILEKCKYLTIIKKNEEDTIKTKKPDFFIEKIPLKNETIIQVISYKIPFLNKSENVIGIMSTLIPFEKSYHTIEKNGSLKKSKISQLDNKNISKREKECLYYLIRGMSAKEIAKILNLSHRTIEFYIHNMKKKFSCTNRIELIAKAYDVINDDN